MLARRFATILPPLKEAEKVEAALVHSVAGEDISGILQGVRPFRSPHHSATAAGLVGGGRPPRPGEASLAHQGVLFLDELAEFSASVLQTLRQPLETGSIVLTRADGSYTFPARFQLLGATNPCPCGYFGDVSGKCRCGTSVVQSYQNKIGGPLIDRIDIRIDVWREDSADLLERKQGKSSAELRNGVECARAFFEYRMRTTPMKGKGIPALKEACNFVSDAETLFLQLTQKEDMSARSVSKMLMLARTIADIDESPQVKDGHVAEAYGLRFGGGLSW